MLVNQVANRGRSVRLTESRVNPCDAVQTSVLTLPMIVEVERRD